MLTLMPRRFTACATRTASAISVPATKRPDTRRPMDEFSANLRRERFSDRWTKNALSMKYLPSPKTEEDQCRTPVSKPLIFVSQLELGGDDWPHTHRVCAFKSDQRF